METTTEKPQSHEITERHSPVAVIWHCECGWRHQETRQQNARARSAKLLSAFRAHLLSPPEAA